MVTKKLDPTLSHTRGPTDTRFLEQTIPENLEENTKRFGDLDALVDVTAGRRWNYSEFRADVQRIASGLLRLGLRKGDRVGIWSPNRWEWTIVQFATAEVGIILVTINPAYRMHELEYALNQASIRAVIAAPQFKSSNYASMLEQSRPNCPALEFVILFGDEEWESMIAAPIDTEALAQIRETLDPNDPINIQYTSGTTGRPKGATLSHRNILNNGFNTGEILNFTEDDRACIPVPFYHTFGMVANLTCTSHGATMVIPAPIFDPEATLYAVQTEKCTCLYGVPTMFIAELALENFDSYDLSSLRTGVMAGAPCPKATMRDVIDRMHMSEVTIGYGMTETSPGATQTRIDDSMDRRIGTVGKAVPHVEIKIIDPATGETLPRGEAGEFCTKGYSVMIGYWDEPEKTKEAIVDGWMHTGDIGIMDADGYVEITGRITDMVIRGGENIYPREIEEFLYTHPDILEAYVIGVPDQKYGEEVMAWVRLKPGAEKLTAEKLCEFATGKLTHHKIPRYVHVVDEFPMTVTGKVRKGELRERAIEELVGKST